MAKLTEQIREKILADYKMGASKRSLSMKYELSIATIFKICKDTSQEDAKLVKQQVAINTQLAEKSETEVKAFHNAVDTATKHLIYFQNRALANQKKADELLEFADDLADIDAHSRITARNKETVLGKSPETIIHNTNAQQNVEQTKIVIERKGLVDE